ncbi:MAG: FHA domain-containing protein [Phycisphaerae bacterium]|nr:FHA domain-containing protein [Phycisphaerae bacterium]
MNSLQTIAEKMDQAIITSRLNSLAVMMRTDHSERLERIVSVLNALPQGAYLIGTGPSTVRIIRLSVEEVVLGRSATPLEKSADAVVDYEIHDAVYLGPYEVSKVHAKIVRTQGSSGWEFGVCDLGSRCGTYVNGKRIGAGDTCHPLSHGDLISLGASHTSTFLMVIINQHDAIEDSGGN